MTETEIDKVWTVTNGIRMDVSDIKVFMARLDEKSVAREKAMEV